MFLFCVTGKFNIYARSSLIHGYFLMSRQSSPSNTHEVKLNTDLVGVSRFRSWHSPQIGSTLMITLKYWKSILFRSIYTKSLEGYIFYLNQLENIWKTITYSLLSIEGVFHKHSRHSGGASGDLPNPLECDTLMHQRKIHGEQMKSSLYGQVQLAL